MPISPVLLKINESLTDPRARSFLRSLFYDTRIGLALTTQPLYEPKSVQNAVNVAEQNKEVFAGAVRGSYPEEYDLYVKIDSTKDTRERLALWSMFLDRQTV